MTTLSTGKFVWFDYIAQDQAKALAFYGELFGWKTQEIPVGGGSYTMFLINDQGIGGFMKTPAGAPPEAHWISHLGVTDAKAAADQVKTLGGRVLKSPEKMGDYGTMGIVADPLGGAFAVWQPGKADNDGDYKGIPGTWCWNELYTADPDRSVAFYSQLGGFTEDKMPMPNGIYHVLNGGGQPRAGVTTPPRPMPQQWMPYVQVASVDQSVEKAKRLGGTIHVPGDDVPGVGRLAILSDSQGAMLGLLQPEKK
ncbi:MAG TPA: VOC family protein [Kofleriaceae bacterium]|nr:VOC family protein [Kofleriaceae bacterium]